MWLEVPNFKENVEHWWNQFRFEGSTSFCLAQKLKALKQEIKNWNKVEFGKVEAHKNGCLKNLEMLDARDQLGIISNAKKIEREEVCRRYTDWLRLEEISWRQKSRVQWLKSMDNNTRFFHQIMNHRAKINDKSRLLINGEWVNDRDHIVASISERFNNLFTDPFPNRPWLHGVDFDMILVEQRSGLE